MRFGRYEKYRKQRFTRIQRFVLFYLVLPMFSFITGYIITLLFILPKVLNR